MTEQRKKERKNKERKTSITLKYLNAGRDKMDKQKTARRYTSRISIYNVYSRPEF